MISSFLPKPGFKSLLVTLFMALQLSACSTEEFLTAIAPEIGSGTETGVDTNLGTDETNPTPNIDMSWVAPAVREDNTPIALSEITGYKIYYGSSQGQYPDSVTINDGSAVDYTFQNFTAGTYYFVVTTIDTEGRESQFSTEVIIAI